MKHDDGGMERMRLRERQPYGGGYEFYDKPMRSDEPKEVLIPYGNPTRGLLKECRTHIDQGGEIYYEKLNGNPDIRYNIDGSRMRGYSASVISSAPSGGVLIEDVEVHSVEPLNDYEYLQATQAQKEAEELEARERQIQLRRQRAHSSLPSRTGMSSHVSEPSLDTMHYGYALPDHAPPQYLQLPEDRLPHFPEPIRRKRRDHASLPSNYMQQQGAISYRTSTGNMSISTGYFAPHDKHKQRHSSLSPQSITPSAGPSAAQAQTTQQPRDRSKLIKSQSQGQMGTSAIETKSKSCNTRPPPDRLASSDLKSIVEQVEKSKSPTGKTMPAKSTVTANSFIENKVVTKSSAEKPEPPAKHKVALPPSKSISVINLSAEDKALPALPPASTSAKNQSTEKKVHPLKSTTNAANPVIIPTKPPTKFPVESSVLGKSTTDTKSLDVSEKLVSLNVSEDSSMSLSVVQATSANSAPENAMGQSWLGWVGGTLTETITSFVQGSDEATQSPKLVAENPPSPDSKTTKPVESCDEKGWTLRTEPDTGAEYLFNTKTGALQPADHFSKAALSASIEMAKAASIEDTKADFNVKTKANSKAESAAKAASLAKAASEARAKAAPKEDTRKSDSTSEKSPSIAPKATSSKTTTSKSAIEKFDVDTGKTAVSKADTPKKDTSRKGTSKKDAAKSSKSVVDSEKVAVSKTDTSKSEKPVSKEKSSASKENKENSQPTSSNEKKEKPTTSKDAKKNDNPPSSKEKKEENDKPTFSKESKERGKSTTVKDKKETDRPASSKESKGKEKSTASKDKKEHDKPTSSQENKEKEKLAASKETKENDKPAASKAKSALPKEKKEKEKQIASNATKSAAPKDTTTSNRDSGALKASNSHFNNMTAPVATFSASNPTKKDLPRTSGNTDSGTRDLLNGNSRPRENASRASGYDNNNEHNSTSTSRLSYGWKLVGNIPEPVYERTMSDAESRACLHLFSRDGLPKNRPLIMVHTTNWEYRAYRYSLKPGQTPVKDLYVERPMGIFEFIRWKLEKRL